MIGEIGGNAEETAPRTSSEHVKKPVVGFIAGQTAPPGPAHGPRRRDHLGRLGSSVGQDRGHGSAGITVCASPAEIGEKIKAAYEPVERTFSIIKPDAVAAGQAGEILAMIEKGGFRILALRMTKLNRQQAEGFYAVHRGGRSSTAW